MRADELAYPSAAASDRRVSGDDDTAGPALCDPQTGLPGAVLLDDRLSLALAHDGDDIVTIEIRAIAGVTYPLVDPTFTPDGAAGLVTDGVNTDQHLLDHFPYVGVPISGYDYAPTGF